MCSFRRLLTTNIVITIISMTMTATTAPTTAVTLLDPVAEAFYSKYRIKQAITIDTNKT